MSVALAKWGNALGVRIPSYIVKKAGLHSGDVVEVTLLEEGVLIKPTQKKHLLEQLLAGITEDNLHSETEWGSVEGHEVW